MKWLIFFIFLLFILKVEAGLVCTNTSSTFINSSGSSCIAVNSTIFNSTIIGSTITNSSVYWSNVSDSTIKYSHIENLSVFFSTVIDNILTSGRIIYRDYTYYPVYNITYIYLYKLPIGVGTFSNEPQIVRDGITVNITYQSFEIGYSIFLNMSNLDSESSGLIELNDDGTTPDIIASDGVLIGSYTINSSNTIGDGPKLINATIHDNKGNIISSSFNITLDNTEPNASISIVPLGQPGFTLVGNEYTSIRVVLLELNYSDTYDVKDCRYGNEFNYSNWESCTGTKSWLLSNENGNRTVGYQVRDYAGNIIEKNDSIYLNKTGVGLDVTPPSIPIVVDPGEWSNSDSLYFYWYNSTDIESTRLGFSVYYKFKINDSSGNIIIDWNKSIQTNTQITLRNLALVENNTYYFNVIAYNLNGYESNVSVSDGIRIDNTQPSSTQVDSSPDATNWTNNQNIFLNWSASDSLSGIGSYSFFLTRNQNINIGDVYVNQNNKTYSYLASGKYYFHIKARDLAGNWGNQSSETLKIDLTTPSTPQLLNQSIASSTTNLSFNWTESRDVTSGISYYFVNITRQDNNQILFNGSVGNVTNYTIEANPNTDYFINIRSYDLASNPSLWSSQASAQIDIDPPIIRLLKPIGRIITHKPYFLVSTNEESRCTYTETTGNEILPYDGTPRTNPFDYTNSTYHESLTTLNSTYSNFSFGIICTDNIGNWNQTNISFIVNSQPPSSIQFSLKNIYYSGTISSFNMIVTNSLGAIGDMSKDTLTIKINDTTISDFSLFDNGAGNYTVKFNVPPITTNSTLIITWYDQSSSTSINIIPLFYNVHYTSQGINPIRYDYLAYAKNSLFTIGIGMTNLTNLSSSNNTINLNSANLKTDSFIFLTTPTAQPNKREKYLKQNNLLNLFNPSFGYLPIL